MRTPPAAQNRIKRLIAEQEKAAKRIDETRKRTSQIRQLRERNTQHVQVRHAPVCPAAAHLAVPTAAAFALKGPVRPGIAHTAGGPSCDAGPLCCCTGQP